MGNYRACQQRYRDQPLIGGAQPTHLGRCLETLSHDLTIRARNPDSCVKLV
jgi:hypothetical protein